jgi:hypothetical protein
MDVKEVGCDGDRWIKPAHDRGPSYGISGIKYLGTVSRELDS